tara:strand:+ start:7283 stop:8446 length:1164 start_codon:yes stop_codon:yes gene_type:complete
LKLNKRKSVIVVSSNRADYSLLEPLMHQLISEKEINFGLIVTGSHLLKTFGYTFNDIHPKIRKKTISKIKVLESTSKASMIKTIGYLIEKFSSVFKRLKPDLVIILGDRYEIFSAATSCHLLQIPLAHIHGGEVTSGALDDGFRHSITKFSDLHFTSSVAHRKRVIQLGEQPRKVFNVGPMVLDNFLDLKFLSKTLLRRRLKILKAKKDFLVCFHPQTLGTDNNLEALKNLIAEMKVFTEYNFIFTASNNDPGGEKLNSTIKKNVEMCKNFYFYDSLGSQLYYSLLRSCDGLIGNSSSGIIETPIFQRYSLNIGDRQKGREKTKYTIDCGTSKTQINKGLRKLFSKSNKVSKLKTKYVSPSKLIVNKVKEKLMGELKKNKSFHDLKT